MAESFHWHSRSIEDCLQEADSTLEGLRGSQIDAARQRHGRNELPPPQTRSDWQVFLDQFKSALIFILLIAAVISALVGEVRDSLVILGVVMLNAVIGYRQERQATTAMNALLRMSPQEVLVIRADQERQIPIGQVVAGDIVVVATGDQVPADGRWMETLNLRVNEATLTGESVPVSKLTEPLPDYTMYQEQRSMGWRGTMVVAGRGRLLVTSVGSDTRFGQIVTSLRAITPDKTPFQKQLETFSKRVAIITVGLGMLIFAIGLGRDLPLHQVFLLAVSMIVSIIPEGLPVVMTIAMTYGMWAMAKRQAIVRKLVAVETLGAVTVVATDKTGTLTYGEMMMDKAWVGGATYHFTGHGYHPEGDIFLQDKKVNAQEQPGLSLLLRLGALNNDSRFTLDANGHRQPIGDPTELALVVAAAKGGWEKIQLEETHPRLGEFPFDYHKKYMITWHRDQEDRQLVILKGAPQAVLDLCRRHLWHDQTEEFTAAEKARVMEVFERWATEALRGLAIAYSHCGHEQFVTDDSAQRCEFTFVGLVGLQDALRPEAKDAIAVMRQAGIRTIMVTGDFSRTGRAVADKLGLLVGADDTAMLDGGEIDQLSDEQLRARLETMRVGTRLVPEHKLRIARLLKQNNEIVAMTGDGINDVPALSEANVGIAVGRQSSDAAKEAAEIVLVDGNYQSITTAIAEGRRIFSNIRRVMYYLLASNFGELVLITITLVGGLPLPLLPTQIIWLNAVTDPFLGVALAREPLKPTIMSEPPHNPREPIITRGIWQRITATSATIGLSAFGVFMYAHLTGRPDTEMFALTLTAIAAAQWLTAFTARSSRRSTFRILEKNNSMYLALITVLMMQLAILYLPPLAKIFQVAPLSLIDWLIVVIAAAPVVVVEEIRKWMNRRRWSRFSHQPAEA